MNKLKLFAMIFCALLSLVLVCAGVYLGTIGTGSWGLVILAGLIVGSGVPALASESP